MELLGRLVHAFLVVLLVLVALWAVLKSWGLVRGIIWAVRRADAYEIEFDRLPPRTWDEQVVLLKRHGGNFLPFGAKSYRLKNRLRRGLSLGVRARIPLAWMAPIVGRWFIALCAAVVVLTNLVGDGRSAPWWTIQVSVAGWLILYNLVLIIEGNIWYLITGTYTRTYMLIESPPGTSRRSVPGREVLAIALFGTTTLVATSVAISALGNRLGGFINIPPGSGIELEAERLLNAAYFAVSTLTTVGSDGVSPDSLWARAVATLLQISGLILVAFSLAIVISQLSVRTSRGSRDL